MPPGRALFFVVALLPLDLPAAEPTVVVKAGVLIDGSGGGAVIVIEGERIKAVGPGLPVPPEARVVDLEGSTVLPGFVDAHTHISLPLVASPGWDQAKVRETATDEVLRGALHARQALEAGYTTIREVGARGFTDVSLRNALRKGGLMAQRGTVLVSTLMAGDAVVRMAKDGRLTGEFATKALAIGPSMLRAIGRARAAGVKFALGTDNIFDPHTTDTREFALLVAAGLTPMEAILAGTRNGAQLLGWENDVGEVKAGRYADLVAVKGDPLQDIGVLQQVHFVMKGGSVVRDGR